MLASDILPPRTVSSRAMLAMLKRLETDSPRNYTFKLLPPNSLSFRRGLGGGAPDQPLSLRERGASERSDVSGVCPGRSGEVDITPRGNTRRLPRTPMRSTKDARRGDEITAHHSNHINHSSNWSCLPKSAWNSPTGLAFLYTKTTDTPYQPRLAIAPPFPIQTEVETTDRETLLQSIDPPLHVGIILIRYGHVAIAIAHDETIVVSKTDSRWVPNKHRAGGQSANRFKRSREKWAREFFDKSARLAHDRFAAYPHHIDHLIFGGDQHVINQFLDRATLPNNLSHRILPRRLNTLRPNRNALKHAVRQTWSSTIYELATGPLRTARGTRSGANAGGAQTGEKSHA